MLIQKLVTIVHCVDARVTLIAVEDINMPSLDDMLRQSY